MEEMFTRLGVPAELHSDQGLNFESKVFGEVCQWLGVEKTGKTTLSLKAMALSSSSTAPWLPNSPS